MKSTITKTILIILTVFVVSCSDSFTFTKRTKILTDNRWKVNTYVDYSQNNTLELRPAVYNFLENGDLIKIYDNNDTIHSSWKLSEDSNYLTIGANTFKVNTLTKRVLSLNYGDVEIFFVSL
jgi:hypothetical protein